MQPILNLRIVRLESDSALQVQAGFIPSPLSGRADETQDGLTLCARGIELNGALGEIGAHVCILRMNKGRGQFKPFWRNLRDAFPDLRISIEDTIAENDRVVVRVILEGTHRGSGIGIPPSGGACASRGQ